MCRSWSLAAQSVFSMWVGLLREPSAIINRCRDGNILSVISHMLLVSLASDVATEERRKDGVNITLLLTTQYSLLVNVDTA